MQNPKFHLPELIANSTDIDQLTVLAYDMSIYLVRLKVGDTTALVYQDDKPKRFFNTQSIREAFAQLNVAKAQMIQESPYDEMIGNPQSAQQGCVLPFSLNQPY